MIQNNYFDANSDLLFTVDHFINWATIIPLKEEGFKDAAEYKKTGDKHLEFAPNNTEEALEGYKAVWQQTGELAGMEVAGAARAMDKHGLKFNNGKVTFPPDMVRLVDLFTQSGLLGYAMGRHHGGLGMNLSASSIVMELVSRADPAFGIALGCYNLAEVIERFGGAKMTDEWVPKMAAGEVTGAMALTEPIAGLGKKLLSGWSLMVLDDGTRAVVHDGGLEIRDGQGRLLVRYADGAATIEAPAGDLILAAPGGRVAIRAAEDIVLDAARDLTLAAGPPGEGRAPQVRLSADRAQIEARQLRAVADRSELVSGEVELVARAIVTSAEQIVETAARVERTAHRLIERARDAFRDVSELSQSRLGRVRTIVREGYSLTSQRTTMVSKDDTSIDGKRILLG